MEVNNKQCTDCGKIFRTPTDLMRHDARKNPCYIRHDGVDNHYRCAYCNKVLSRSQHLRRHLVTCRIRINAPDIPHINKPEPDPLVAELQEQVKQLQIQLARTTSSVYFIAETPWTGHVKIGYAADVNKRLAQLQTGNAHRLYVHRTITCAGARARETQLHREFAKHRIGGEWFALTREQIAAV